MKGRDWLWVAVFALVHMAALLWLGAQLGTSPDEEYALASTAQGPAFAFHRALTTELQAPLYFVVASLWRELNASYVFARVFSILLTTCTLFVVAAISKRVLPQRSPLWLTAGYAISPMTLYAAVDIRSYALSMLFVALATLAFLDGWWLGTSTRARIAFTCVSILGVSTHYYAAFSVFAFGVGLACAWRPRQIPSFVAYASVVAAATLVAVKLVASQFDAYDFVANPPLLAAREVIATPFDLFFVPGDAFGDHAAAFAIARVAMIVALVAGLIDFRDTSVRFWSGVIAGLLSAYLTSALVLHVYFSPPRHYFVYAVPALVWFAVAISSMARPRGLIAGRFAIALYAGTALVAAFNIYGPLAKDGDWMHAAPFVAAHTRAGDAVAVFEADDRPGFVRFYPGTIPVAQFPHPVDLSIYDENALLIRTPDQARAGLRRLMTGRSHAWLAIDCAYVEHLRYDGGCTILRQAIDELYPTRGRWDFYKGWVAELPSARSSR